MVDSDYYKAMAWAGLTETAAYLVYLIPLDQSMMEFILERLTSEQVAINYVYEKDFNAHSGAW